MQPTGGRRTGADKRRAVLTIVHNEPVFLPIWLRYYSQFFGPDDTYVLDHGSTDGSTSGGGFVRVPVAHESVDHRWLVETVMEHQHALFERYDVVLVTDVDEIVAPDPATGTLGDYIDRFDDEFVNCTGYEILHLKDREPPLRDGKSILSQRGCWFRNPAYDKPILATAPQRWFPGFHARTDGAYNLDTDLYLIHLHRMDWDLCVERHRTRRVMQWHERDLKGKWGTHNRLVDDADLEHWFYEVTGIGEYPVVREEIPERFSAVV